MYEVINRDETIQSDSIERYGSKSNAIWICQKFNKVM